MAAIRLSVPKTAKQGEIIELKDLIRHDMESGYRRDTHGKAIPRKILTHFKCQYNDTVIFSVDMHPGVSANPILKFHTRATESGTLLFTWTEQTGEVFSKSADITVTS